MKRPAPSVRRVALATYRHHWKALLFGLLALVCGQAGALLIPKVAGIAVDQIRELGAVVGERSSSDIFSRLTVEMLGLEPDASDRMLRCVVGLALLALIVGVFQYFKRLLLTGLSRRYEYRMREALFAHLQSLPGRFYTQMRSGDVVSRATSDVEATRMVFGPALMYVSETLILMPLALTAMYSVSPELTAWVMLPLGLVMVTTLIYSPRQRKYNQEVQEAQGDLSARAQENFSGVRVVKAFGREDYEAQSFDQLSGSLLGSQLKLARVRQMYQALLMTLPGLGLLIILYIGARGIGLSGAERITLGEMLEFFFYYTLLTWPMMAIGWVTALVLRGYVSAKRINEIFNQTPDSSTLHDNAEGQRTPQDFGGRVAFEAVGYEYVEGQPVLDDVSFVVEAGKTLGIVGPVGSGKSTIADLLLRLDKPTHGRIAIDGLDIAAIDPAFLREKIGYVPQETFLFSESIAYNVGFGLDQEDTGRIEAATRYAGMETEVADLPKGYATLLGERGVNLSGGQKQRLAIARALAKRPRIMVLDDCLSAVDTKTEESILRALKEELESCTTIMIAQRVSTIAHADEIVVLDEGRIVERGTHEQLMALGGLYATMAQRQQMQAAIASEAEESGE